MIVVVTNNGCRYINETAITMLSHIKDEAMVEVWPKCMSVTGITLEPTTIHNVERVIYTDNARDINDPGATIEDLEEKLSKMREDYDNLSNLYQKTEAEYRVAVEKLEAYKAIEPKPEYKIHLRAVTPMGSDCTKGYEVDNCEGMRLGDLVAQANILDKYTSFRISDANGYIGDCQYEKQKMESSRLNAKKVCGIDDRIVKSAKASGGWGRMDYDVIIE